MAFTDWQCISRVFSQKRACACPCSSWRCQEWTWDTTKHLFYDWATALTVLNIHSRSCYCTCIFELLFVCFFLLNWHRKKETRMVRARNKWSQISSSRWARLFTSLSIYKFCAPIFESVPYFLMHGNKWLRTKNRTGIQSVYKPAAVNQTFMKKLKITKAKLNNCTCKAALLNSKHVAILANIFWKKRERLNSFVTVIRIIIVLYTWMKTTFSWICTSL